MESRTSGSEGGRRKSVPLTRSNSPPAYLTEMQPFFNRLPDGGSMAVLGLGDGIAHVLKGHLKARQEEVKEAEAAKAT